MMKLARKISLFLLLFSASAWADRPVLLRVQGIHNVELNQNVRIHLQAIDPQEADGSERYQQLVREEIGKALRAYGYYESEVNFSVDFAEDNSQRSSLLGIIKNNDVVQTALKTVGYYDSAESFTLDPNKEYKGDKPLLIADVTLGKPVKLEQVDVQITGQAQGDPQFEKLNQTLPKPGTQLNHETYEDYKSNLQKLARQRGYFDAEFSVHRLEVMPSTHQAWWRLYFDSGERYRYGEINAKITCVICSQLNLMTNMR